MRRFPLALSLATLLATLPMAAGPAGADDRKVTELDRRATLALYNSIQTGTVFTLEGVDPVHVRGLDVFQPSGPEGERVYAARFGAQGGTGDGRGYHKITIGGGLADPAQKGWALLGRNASPAADMFWKRIENSDADKYTDIAIRGKVGRVIMTVAQRRPFRETPEAGAADLLVRYKRLVAAARAAGLFERVEVALLPADGGEPVAFLGGEPPRTLLGVGGLRYGVRLKVLDTEDQPVQAKAFTIALAGPLARHARIDGATTFDPRTGRYVITNPGLEAVVTLVMDPPTTEVERELYAQLEGPGATNPRARGVRIVAGAKL